MIDCIEKAKAFAMMAHKGQTDKAGEDYFTAHVAVVADGVEPDPLVKAVVCFRGRHTMLQWRNWHTRRLQTPFFSGFDSRLEYQFF